MKFVEIVDEIKKIADIRMLSYVSEKEISKIKLWERDLDFYMDSVVYFGYDRQPTNWPEHYVLAANATSERWSRFIEWVAAGESGEAFAKAGAVKPGEEDAAAGESGEAFAEAGAVKPGEEDAAAGESGETFAEVKGGESGDSFANLALIPEEDFAIVFNHIQDILAERTQGDYQRHLMELADKVHSVDALIDSASENFNASLVLIDRDYRILSYSNKIPVTDELWVDNIRRGYCDYEFISAVKQMKSIRMAGSGMTPFEVTCTASPFRKLACRVYCKEAWVGSLLLIEGDHTYRAEHAEMLQMLSSVTGYSLLAHSPELLSRTSDYQRFLYNLLIGTPIENLPEPYRAMKFREDMRLLYFTPQSVEALPIKSMDLQETFRRELRDCHVIAYRKAVIVICGLPELKGAERLLMLFPSEYEVKVGISNAFQRVEDLHEALEEARDALTVGAGLNPEGRIFTFEEFSRYIMLRHLSETEDITRYLHPAVCFLQRYDEKYKAKMIPTLRTYLQNGCNIKETAEALFMHRNSVIYRLHKAEEISGLDLDDVDTRFALRMSFLILEFR